MVQIKLLAPSQIRYTKERIKSRFKNGNLLIDVFQDLLFSNLHPNDLGLISVVEQGGSHYVFHGNRRLCLHKKLEEIGKIRKIKVLKHVNSKELKKRYTSKREKGSSIKVSTSGDTKLLEKMDKIGKVWKIQKHLPEGGSFEADSNVELGVKNHNMDKPTNNKKEKRVIGNKFKGKCRSLSESGEVVTVENTVRRTLSDDYDYDGDSDDSVFVDIINPMFSNSVGGKSVIGVDVHHDPGYAVGYHSNMGVNALLGPLMPLDVRFLPLQAPPPPYCEDCHLPTEMLDVNGRKHVSTIDDSNERKHHPEELEKTKMNNKKQRNTDEKKETKSEKKSKKKKSCCTQFRHCCYRMCCGCCKCCCKLCKCCSKCCYRNLKALVKKSTWYCNVIILVLVLFAAKIVVFHLLLTY